jgi:molybdenum cofactor biosynthesis enzyme MoaA
MANAVARPESYPTGVALPIADLCNARCTFCTSWLEGRKLLKADQLAPYLEVLPYARQIGFQGHGEPLANPQIGEILQRVAEVVDPRAEGYLISNGVFLGKHLDALLASRITVFNLSLNAVTPETHEAVMGLGLDALDKIITTIRRIIDLRAIATDIQVTISMVLNAANFHEAARFVELGNELGVDRIYLRTLMPIQGNGPPGLNYHALSPSLRPDFEQLAGEARAAIAASRVAVVAQPETWGEDCLTAEVRAEIVAAPPPLVSRAEAVREHATRHDYDERGARAVGRHIEYVDDLQANPYGRRAPLGCSFVYTQLITTKLTMEMYPCCYMTKVPGHEPLVLSADRPFREFWNSEAMVNLRTRLASGPLYQACATCPMQG